MFFQESQVSNSSVVNPAEPDINGFLALKEKSLHKKLWAKILCTVHYYIYPTAQFSIPRNWKKVLSSSKTKLQVTTYKATEFAFWRIVYLYGSWQPMDRVTAK